MMPQRRQVLRFALGAAVAGLATADSTSTADETREVELKAPLLVCHALAGGVRPPTAEGAEPEHDLVFFVLAGRNPDGSEIRQVAPKEGGHFKVDNTRKGMVVKNVHLWKGTIKAGEAVTLAVSVREQDAGDTAESDLDEAAGIASKIDNTTSLSELARIPVHAILQGEHGENDHIGTVVVRIKNVSGRVSFESEPGENIRYLKGHASNHTRRRAYKLNGDHSDYELHLSLED